MEFKISTLREQIKIILNGFQNKDKRSIFCSYTRNIAKRGQPSVISFDTYDIKRLGLKENSLCCIQPHSSVFGIYLLVKPITYRDCLKAKNWGLEWYVVDELYPSDNDRDGMGLRRIIRMNKKTRQQLKIKENDQIYLENYDEFCKILPEQYRKVGQ